MKLKCIIVDDEPPAQRLLENYIRDIDYLELVAKCNSAFEANEVLMNNMIDLMFLDINMPKMSGLMFIETLDKRPAIIITTAFREYALEGFELNVVDYLKKPFPFQRFLKAVNKATHKINLSVKHQNHKKEDQSKVDHIFLKEEKAIYKINYKDILYFKAMGDYIKVYTQNKTYLTYMPLKRMEELLPEDRFKRIHKSYIVAIDKIEKLEGNIIKISNSVIPIGQTFKKALFQIIEKSM